MFGGFWLLRHRLGGHLRLGLALARPFFPRGDGAFFSTRAGLSTELAASSSGNSASAGAGSSSADLATSSAGSAASSAGSAASSAGSAACSAGMTVGGESGPFCERGHRRVGGRQGGRDRHRRDRRRTRRVPRTAAEATRRPAAARRRALRRDDPRAAPSDGRSASWIGWFVSFIATAVALPLQVFQSSRAQRSFR